MPISACLYDAEGEDRTVPLDAQMIHNLRESQLLWIDLEAFNEGEARQVGALLGLKRESIYDLLQPIRRPRLDNYGAYFQLSLDAIHESGPRYGVAELDFIVGENYVVTAHREPVAFLKSFDRRVKGDSQLGQLGAPSFLAALLDWHVTSYFRVVEALEAKIDRLDELALHPHSDGNLLDDLIVLRRQVAQVRRTLTPHREVYAALARPDFLVLSSSESAGHFRALNDRLERAVDTVENARDLLVGSFEMFTTRTALRTNEVMKTLTLFSVVLLPAGVIVAIMGMTFRSPVYEMGALGFWAMLALIVLIGLLTVTFARRRRWI
ncbi:MAG TPA: magnesium transporter CorA family protein [Chthonomonadaceae bacterium]|nr:magnesium transporter CorA family protein [Chthonomonadaceae bacterium]